MLRTIFAQPSPQKWLKLSTGRFAVFRATRPCYVAPPIAKLTAKNEGPHPFRRYLHGEDTFGPRGPQEQVCDALDELSDRHNQTETLPQIGCFNCSTLPAV